MWYVIQVQTGHERAMAELIEHVAPGDVLDECFYPQFETEMKVRGAWVPVTKPLFPGYVIAVSDDPCALWSHLRKIPQPMRLLSMGEDYVPLSQQEVELIGGFSSKGNRVVPMSHAVKDGDTVVVTSGPLLGREGLIKGVNRAKSVAFLETELCGRRVSIRVGLSIVSSSNTSVARAASARVSTAGNEVKAKTGDVPAGLGVCASTS